MTWQSSDRLLHDVVLAGQVLDLVMQGGGIVAKVSGVIATGATGVAVTALLATGLWIGDDAAAGRARSPFGVRQLDDAEATSPHSGPGDVRESGDDGLPGPVDTSGGTAGAGPLVLGIDEAAGPTATDEQVVADFSVSTTHVLVGDPVVFVDASSGDPTSWSWDFGDGTSDSSAEVVKSWSSPGRYLVILTVADESSSDSASTTVTVLDEIEPPEAIIQVDDDNVATGVPVRLRSVSAGELLDVLWDFGDGAAATTADVTHSYVQPGTYVVTLIVSNPAGSSTATVTVTVYASAPPPVARIGPLPAIVEAGVGVTLESISLNDPDTVEWDFGDGSTGTGTPVTHTWLADGTYDLTLVATNESGSTSTTVAVTVLPYLPPPVASFAAPTTTNVGSLAGFVDTSSHAATWSWDFGDGASATTPSASHSYTSEGTFVVSLTVTNRNGADTATATIEVLPPPPALVARFTPSAESVGTDEPVVFTNLSTGAVSHSWDFGDGNTSTELSPTHAYTNPGAFTVVLTVTNGVGDTDTAEVKIRVNRGS